MSVGLLYGDVRVILRKMPDLYNLGHLKHKMNAEIHTFNTQHYGRHILCVQHHGSHHRMKTESTHTRMII